MDERTKAIDTLVKKCIDDGWIDYAIRAAELGASEETVNALVKKCVDNGWIDYAIRAAKVGGRKLTVDEINALVKKCVDNERINDTAIRAAELDALEETINALVKKCIDNGRIDDAIRAAKVGGRKLTVDEIEKLTDNI